MTWEYFTHTLNVAGWFVSGDVDADELTKTLNSFGAQGWELVSSTSTISNDSSKQLVFVFKRPVGEG
jgi:Domain of unknown function (DUF4177)